jgi:hypothetical protein
MGGLIHITSADAMYIRAQVQCMICIFGLPELHTSGDLSYNSDMRTGEA